MLIMKVLEKKKTIIFIQRFKKNLDTFKKKKLLFLGKKKKKKKKKKMFFLGKKKKKKKKKKLEWFQIQDKMTKYPKNVINFFKNNLKEKIQPVAED